MHVEQDRAVRSGAACYSVPLALDEFEVPADAITVMIASGRKALHAAWFSMLARESGIEIGDEPVIDASCLAGCVEHRLPQVLLLDKALLDGLDPRSLRRIQAQCHHVRVLLVWDEICQDLVADVLRNRFSGFLLTTCMPDVCVKAIRAVSEGELWLSRASLVTAIADLLGLSNPGGAGASADGLQGGVPETLTPRELQVVALLRRGCINKEIAQELGIMEDTVKKHLQSVFAKLGVHRRALVALSPLPGYGLTHSIP
jgi:DNA-binding NarL/FixJ family response regulator